MSFQQIYNATYNHFAERKLWPQYISYDPEWEFSINDSIREVFESGKRDGIIEKLDSELKDEVFDEIHEKCKKTLIKQY